MTVSLSEGTQFSPSERDTVMALLVGISKLNYNERREFPNLLSKVMLAFTGAGSQRLFHSLINMFKCHLIVPSLNHGMIFFISVAYRSQNSLPTFTSLLFSDPGFGLPVTRLISVYFLKNFSASGLSIVADAGYKVATIDGGNRALAT